MKNTESFNLTNPQMGIWYAEQFYPERGVNNIAATLHFEGELDFTVLNKAFNEFIRLNDGLRLRITSKGTEITQYVSEYTPCQLEIFDHSQMNKEEFEEWEKNLTRTPFFGEDKDLFYFCLLRLPEEKTGFFVKFHHIISDAWSTVLIGDQVMHIYKDMLADPSYIHDPVPSYVDFINKDDAYINSEKFTKDKEYWLSEFENVPEIAPLKSIKKKNTTIAADRKSFQLPEKLVKKLKSYEEEHKKTLFALFLSAMAIYMNRVTEKEDLVIGIPSLNRSGALEKSMFGMFVTTIPIVLKVPVDDTYINFSEEVTLKWRNILRHHKYPVSRILKDVREVHPGVEKLYDVVISYQNAKFTKSDIDGEYDTKWHFQGEQTESLYIHINDRENDGQILLDYDYLSDVFHEKDIEALHDHFIRILWHTLDASPDRKIKDIEMVSENEKKLIFDTFNDTKADFPDDVTMIDIFRRRAKETPDEQPLFFGDLRMTYREIDRVSDQIADCLVSKGTVPNDVVGIMFRRSFEMMISIIAIWKAGGAYMPIDPDFPSDRIEYMLENSGAKTILSVAATIEDADFDKSDIDIIDVNDLKQTEKEFAGSSGLVEHRPDDLAYVIYTSGSTGKPKGVMNEHRALVNRINWMQKKYPIGKDDVILQKTTYIFDVSVWELTWWFYAGARMVLLAPGEEKNPGAIITAIEQYAVTTMHFVPSMLGAFLTYLEASDEDAVRSLRTLRRVFASGEALTIKDTDRFNTMLGSANKTELHNLYGPTEAAIDVSYYDCSSKINTNSVPIGRPIDNIKLYIVNQYNKLQPINVAGELCIAGVGLARGYLNNEELTNEKFVDNPFEPGTKMYRTGDLARWFPRGDIEYLGRIDSQIKIRGYRVELGEIQSHIMSFGKIDNAIITSAPDAGGNTSICAYIVPEGGKENPANISTDELNDHLKSKIPEYMLPQSYVIIDELPLLSNGKVNYKALPKPKVATTYKGESISPRNPMESEIFSVWCNVLGKSNFGIKDDFFSPELGGDSLRAIEVVSMLPRKNDAIIDITDFYQNSTIEALAAIYTQDDEVMGERRKRHSMHLLELSTNITQPSAPRDGITYICCPYGGGSGYVFSQLAQSLQFLHNENDENFSVYAVNLPRHDFDTGEPIFVDIESVAERIMTEIRANEKICAGKIVIYAHCVGNALGLKLLRKFENENFDVACLFSGGILPPKYIKFMPEEYDPWKRLKDDSVLKHLIKIGLPAGEIESSTKADMMSAFRFDVKEYYKYLKHVDSQIRNPMESPIIAVVGTDDQMVRGYNRRYKQYGNYTYGKTSLIVIKNAKHYFVKTHADILAEEMRTKLIEDDLIGGGIRCRRHY